MSFFGYLAAGAADGVGKGLVGEADYSERLGRERALLAEKQAGALQLQRERADDKAALQLTLAEMRGGPGGGGGKGGSFFDNLLLTAKTPEEQATAVEYARMRGGDDAARVVQRRFNLSGDTETVNPSTGDAARYDRTLDENGQSAQAAPASFTQRASYDAEKGRIALNRVIAMADPGKYDDYTKGEKNAYALDSVRGATDDKGVRAAGSRVMALEGKDRFAVQGDNLVDKAGVEGVKPTDLGKAKANDENASAGEHSAKAKKASADPLDTEELRTLQQLRLSAEGRLKDARKALTEYDKNASQLSKGEREKKAGERTALEAEVTGARGEFDKIATRLTSRLDRANKDEKPAEPKPKPAEEAPLPMPKDKSALVTGKTYSTSRGKAKWNGSAFEAL